MYNGLHKWYTAFMQDSYLLAGCWPGDGRERGTGCALGFKAKRLDSLAWRPVTHLFFQLIQVVLLGFLYLRAVLQLLPMVLQDLAQHYISPSALRMAHPLFLVTVCAPNTRHIFPQKACLQALQLPHSTFFFDYLATSQEIHHMHGCFSESCPCIAGIKIAVLKEQEAFNENGTDARSSQSAGHL